MTNYFPTQKQYSKSKHALFAKSSTKTTPERHTDQTSIRKMPYFQILQIQQKIDGFQNLKLLTPVVKISECPPDQLHINSTYQARNGFG